MEHGGEHLDTLERVIVSPVAGVFTPHPELPAMVTVGASLGVVRVGSEDVPVVSPFAGVLMGLEALEGERLEPYQRVAWVRAA